MSTPQAAADPLRAQLTGKPDPAAGADTKPLLDALTAANVEPGADDLKAVAWLGANADAETLAVITGWINTA